MVELVKKKLTKIVGIKKEQFNDFIKQKEISVVKSRLIPMYKLGDEMALTSVLLSSLRLVKEFRQQVFANAKMSRGGKAYFYTEVSFAEFPESRVDGLILVVKSGVIKDAAILEVKNGRDKLDQKQLERYQQIARKYSIPNFITISNEFVTEPSQSPLPLKSYKAIDMYHFSWSYLLTLAHVLLFKNDTNIGDEDQIEIMKEVVHYFESDKAGVLGHNRMSSEWGQVVDKVNKGGSLKASDQFVYQAVRSWQQQERDMALVLSRAIGFVVECGHSKYKGDLAQRLDDDCKALVQAHEIDSLFRVKGAASDIGAKLLFGKRAFELEVTLKVPTDKTTKGQIGWLKRQAETCHKKTPLLFDKLSKSIFVEPRVKASRSYERVPLGKFETISGLVAGKELKEFRLVYVLDFGARFSSPTKFVELSQAMLKDFYSGIVQHLVRWEPRAPKMVRPQGALDEETFIDQVNSGNTYLDISKVVVSDSEEGGSFFVNK